jgi:hypothetical protein
MPALPLRIRRHTTEFGKIWHVTNQDIVIGMFRRGEDAIAFLHRELVALQRNIVAERERLAAEQERNERIARILLLRAQQNTDKELAAQNKLKELGK